MDKIDRMDLEGGDGSLKANIKADIISLSRYNNEIARTFLRFGSAAILSTWIFPSFSRRLKGVYIC